MGYIFNCFLVYVYTRVEICSQYIHYLVYDRKSLQIPNMVYEKLNVAANFYLLSINKSVACAGDFHGLKISLCDKNAPAKFSQSDSFSCLRVRRARAAL